MLIFGFVIFLSTRPVLTMANFVWLAFYTNLAKLFSNSLLASLNERNSLRAKMTSVNLQDSSLRSATHANISQPSRLVFAKQQANSAVELHSMAMNHVRGLVLFIVAFLTSPRSHTWGRGTAWDTQTRTLCDSLSPLALSRVRYLS